MLTMKRFNTSKMNKSWYFSLIITLIFMTIGCAIILPTDPYKKVDLFVHKNDVKPSDFTTKAISGAPLSLTKVIEIAISNNPEISAMHYDVEAAIARQSEARGALFPRISAEGSYFYNLDNQRLIPARYNGEPGVFSEEIISGDVVLRMPLFMGGKLINEIKAASLLRQSVENRLARTREELVFNISSTFFSILAQEHIINSLQFSQTTMEKHLQQVNDLISAQKAAKVDQLRTEVRLSDVRQKLVREKNTLMLQHRLLANLMGVEEISPMFTLEGALEKFLPELPLKESCLDLAFEQRPDYHASRKELEAQTRRVDIARAGHLPTISLFGSYGRRWAEEPSEQPSGTKDDEDIGRVGIVAEIPLFEGGRIRARIREETAKLAAAQERLRKIELQIRLEVETALLNTTSAFERVQTTEKAIEQARESLRIEREKYELGKGAILDVLDAQSALLEAETNYYRGLTDFNIAKVQIKLAMGEDIK